MTQVLKVQEFEGIKYMQLEKSEENKRFLASFALLAMIKLENKEIEVIVINGRAFNRESFQFKTGRFNNNKARECLIWSYYLDPVE